MLVLRDDATLQAYSSGLISLGDRKAKSLEV